MAQKVTIDFEDEYRPTGFDSPWYDKLLAMAQLPTQKERNEAYEEILQDACRHTRDRFVKETCEHDIRPSDLHASFGIPYSYISKFFSGQKSIPTNIMGDVCYNMFHMSANELVFGEPSRIVIPQPLHSVIERAETGELENAQVALTEVMNRYKDRIIRESVHKPIPAALIHERLRSIMDETGLHLRAAMLTNDWIGGVKRRMQLREDLFEQHVPSVKRLVGYCFRWRLPMDFFLVKDYTRYSELYYRHNGELVQIRSKLYRTLVSLYLRLSEDDKVRMMADCFLACLKN